MRPKFQSKQSIVIDASIEKVWEYNQDLSKIPDYHPRVNKVDLVSAARFRAAGVAYQCHLTEGKHSCIEKDVEVIPMEKIVTVFESDTMGLTRLLPDYVVESTVHKIDDHTTRVEIAHFYSTSSTRTWLANFIIKPKIARETREMLQSMKSTIEAV